MAHIWGSSRLQAVADHTEIIGSLAEQRASNFAEVLRTGVTMTNMKFSNVTSVANQSPHVSLQSRCWYK